MNSNIDLKYISDAYEVDCQTFEDLMKEVAAMEDNSRWIPGIVTNDIQVNSIDGPIAAEALAQTTGMDVEVLKDTATDGTSLYLNVGNKNWALRGSGKGTLFSRAGISGSALGRLSPADLAEVLNLCLNVSKGSALMLERYGKLSAVHSDASDGYRVMPISELLNITNRELRARFGDPEFVSGTNSHSYTCCVWMLPDVKEELQLKYATALEKKIGPHREIDVMPCLRFSSSDTASCSAIAQPLFRASKSGGYLQLAEGVQVKHSRKASGMDGIEQYQKEVQENLYTKFFDSIEQVGRLGKVEIWHPENAVIGICNDCRISKKYGDIAREEAVRVSIGEECLSAYDVFLCLAEMLGQAETNGASKLTQETLAEKVYKTMNPKFDWSKFDVGGTVAWSGVNNE